MLAETPGVVCKDPGELVQALQPSLSVYIDIIKMGISKTQIAIDFSIYYDNLSFGWCLKL